MILTEVGEIGVHAGDSTYVLRPSLYAMTQIGDPVEIVRAFTVVMADAATEETKQYQFEVALGVIHACSDDDLSHVFGYYDEDLKYIVGQSEKEHIVYLAQCLLKHGLIGIDSQDNNEQEIPEDYTPKFEARKHVAAAMAHLGLSERDAWQITMTGLIGAIKSKYPPSKSP